MDIVILKKRGVVISEKDVKIMEMIASGEQRLDIAKKLKLSIRTIEAHVYKIKEKFGAKSQEHLIAILFRNNVLK